VSAEAEPPLITPTRAGLLALAAVFAFSALLVLMTYASGLASGDNGGGHALSKSAVGFAGLAKSLKDLGAPVVVSRRRLPGGRSSGLYILTPPAEAADAKVTPMGFKGPVLAVLPKWETFPDPRHRGWVAPFTLVDAKSLAADTLFVRAHVGRRRGLSRPVLHGVGAPFAIGTMLRAGPIVTLQHIDLSASKVWTPVLVDETGATVLAKRTNAPLYLLSDPDLLDNQGLRDLAGFTTAAAIIEPLRSGDGPVIFDVTLNGLGAQRSALNLMFDPPFLAVTLCLAVAAALAGVQAFCRFGPAHGEQRAIAHGKEALVDNTAALIRMAGKERSMGLPYAQLTRELAARAVGAPRGLTGEALDALLDRIAARNGVQDTHGMLAVMARTAPDRGRLLAAARRLYRWRTEMIGDG
jgi:hypothetical protein